MDLTQIRLTFLGLGKERFRREQELLKHRRMLGGPLVWTRLTCGKKGCHCGKKGGKKHGPYAYVQIKEGDRYTHRYIHKQPKLIELAQHYSDFIGGLAKVRQLSRQMDELLVGMQQGMIQEVKDGKKKRG